MKNEISTVEQSEQNTGCEVAKTIGDCAYGDHPTRQRFAEAGRNLVARVPKQPNTGFYGKPDFVIDLETNTITCPQGHTTTHFQTVTKEGKLFQFSQAVCAACPVRTRCVKSPTHGRTIFVHRQEDQIQNARAYQKTDAFTEDIQARQVVEHRIARLMQLKMRQSRFFGRAKTLFQLVMAATVANLTLIFKVTRKTGDKGRLWSLRALITTMATALMYGCRTRVTSPPRYAMAP